MAVEVAADPPGRVDRPAEHGLERHLAAALHGERREDGVVFGAEAHDDVIVAWRHLLPKRTVVAVHEVFHGGVSAVGTKVRVGGRRWRVGGSPGRELNLAGDRPAGLGGDSTDDEAGLRERHGDIEPLAPDRIERHLRRAAPRGLGHGAPRVARRGQVCLQPAIGARAPIAMRRVAVEDRDQCVRDRATRVADEDRRRHEREAFEPRRNRTRGKEVASGKHPAHQFHRATRRDRHLRASFQRIPDRIPRRSRRRVAILAGYKCRLVRNDAVRLPKPLVVPPHEISSRIHSGGERAVGPNAIARLEREFLRMRIGEGRGHGDEVFAVGERIDDIDAGLPGSGTRGHAEGHLSAPGRKGPHAVGHRVERGADGLLHRRADELECRGPVRRIEGAQLVIGRRHLREIDDAASDVLHGHIRMTCGTGCRDHGDDPVVSQQMVAQNPVCFLACGRPGRPRCGDDGGGDRDDLGRIEPQADAGEGRPEHQRNQRAVSRRPHHRDPLGGACAAGIADRPNQYTLRTHTLAGYRSTTRHGQATGSRSTGDALVLGKTLPARLRLNA